MIPNLNLLLHYYRLFCKFFSLVYSMNTKMKTSTTLKLVYFITRLTEKIKWNKFPMRMFFKVQLCNKKMEPYVKLKKQKWKLL